MKIKYRVKSHEDFQKVIQQKKKVSNQTYVIYFKSNEFGYARIGISTSKKLGCAVIRNRIRRQVRVMVQNNVDFNKSIDYCIIVRNNFLNNDFNLNSSELMKLFMKI